MIGYKWLAVVAKEAGMNFITFNFILSTVATMLIARIILKLCNNPCMVISLIYMYPLVDNVIQKRWYYALGILVTAIPLLYERKDKKKLLIFSLLCMLASQFHSAAIFYLVFVVLWITGLAGTIISPAISWITNGFLSIGKIIF